MSAIEQSREAQAESALAGKRKNMPINAEINLPVGK